MQQPIRNLSEPDPEVRVIAIQRGGHALYKKLAKGSILEYLMKQTKENLEGSNVKGMSGRRPHPFNMEAIVAFQTSNPYHSTCIQTKKEATVGLGFKSDKVFKALKPYCHINFADVMGDVAEDYFNTGNGYIEVVRNAEGNIRGVYHVRSQSVWVNVEEDRDIHYEVKGQGSAAVSRFAKFGDLERVKTKFKLGKTSEIIHFRMPSAISKLYGFPDWLAATASIELFQAMDQYHFDFFLNRGVPEFILSVSGTKQVAKETWEKIEKVMKAQIGIGNTHKSVAINLVGQDYKVQVDKLALDSQSDSTAINEKSDNLALRIVSAHRIPPLLAGIALPGKMAAANELPNALAACHVLVTSPAQKNFSRVLADSFGDPALNGDLDLSETDFLGKPAKAEKNELGEEQLGDKGNGFHTVVESVAEAMQALQKMDTMSRMKETLPEANASGRNLGAGVLRQRRTATPGAVAASEDAEEVAGTIIGSILSAALQKSMHTNGAVI